MDELLTDLVPFSGDQDTFLLWNNFSVPTTNSLCRMLSRHNEGDSWKRGISYKNIVGLRVSDLTDIPFVGEYRKGQLLAELRDTFSSLEALGVEESLSTIVDQTTFDDFQTDSIDSAQNLEELIEGILEVYGDYREIDDRTLAILRGRVPAFLDTPRTLDDLGNEFGVTRERIRQIESKFHNLQLGALKDRSAVLEKLVAELESSHSHVGFMNSASNGNLLGREKISVTKLKAILQVFGIEELISKVEAVEANWDSVSEALGVLETQAKAYRNKFGLIDLLIFTSDTNSTNMQAFEAIKRVYPRSIMKGNLVLARTASLDTAFENAIGKQLMVFGELDAEVLLIGIERQAAYRQVSILGSNTEQIALIMDIAGDSPSYEAFMIQAKNEPELSQTDVWFLELFQESPTGMLHRNEISAAAIRDGKNLASVSVFLLFNVFLRPAGAAVMTLANVKVEPEAARRYAAIARAIQEQTQLEFSFSGSDVLLRIVPNVNTMAAGVLFPRVELKEMIKDAVFKVVCECGKMNSVQELKLRPPNFWTGFTAAIKHCMDYHYFAKGDELNILLNFESGTATCQVP